MNSIVLFAHGISQTRPKFVRLCLRKGKKKELSGCGTTHHPSWRKKLPKIRFHSFTVYGKAFLDVLSCILTISVVLHEVVT